MNSLMHLQELKSEARINCLARVMFDALFTSFPHAINFNTEGILHSISLHG